MNKLKIFALILAILTSPALASENNWVSVQYYKKGQEFLKNAQYSNAISEFKKALRITPEGFNQRASLINAYIARASYYYNKTKEYSNSLNDTMSALFYIKYYNNNPIPPEFSAVVPSAENNVKILMQHLNLQPSAEQFYKKAQQLRAQGNFAAAAVAFNYALADDKYKKNSYIALGDISNILNSPKMTVKYYEKALQIESNPNVNLKLARAYEILGQTNLAVEQYNLSLASSQQQSEVLNALEKIWLQKINDNPADAEAQANLGVIYQKKGDFNSALAQYQKAEKLNPTNTNTRINLGTLYQQQGSYSAAIQIYDEILATQPKNVQAHYYKAQCLKEIGNTTSAINEYQQALKIDPNYEYARNELLLLAKNNYSGQELLNFVNKNIKNTTQNASIYYDFAYDLHKSGKVNDAIIFYEQALNLNPQMPDAYINLAQAYKDTKNYTLAGETLARANKILPSNAAISEYTEKSKIEMTNNILNKAITLFNENKYKQAIDEYQKIAPATEDSLIGIAACYQKMENYDEAINYYKKAFQLNSKNPEIAYYVAVLEAQKDNNTEAIIYLNKSLALKNNYKEALDLLESIQEEEAVKNIDKAIALYDSQNYEEGLAILNTILTKDTKNAHAYYYRGMFYDALKKYDLAIADYQKALEYNKDLIVAQYLIGVDYDYLAKYKEAHAAFKKYVAIDLEKNEYTEYAKQRLIDLKQYD